MTPSKTTTDKQPSHIASFLLLVGLNIGFFVLTQFPIANLLLIPLDLLVTTLHELGHALACLATGGYVDALTVVSDGDGHGGVTWTHGGWEFLIDQAGYLGATLFGCLLIALGRKQESAKLVLSSLGVLLALTAFGLIGPGLFAAGGPPGTQALESLCCCLVLAAGVILLGAKLPPRAAHIALLIIAGQTALNALQSAYVLVVISTGMAHVSTSFTDATNMASLTHLPAALWSILWALASVAMLAVTLNLCFGGKSSRTNV